MTSVPGRVRCANNADPADTSGFDRLAAQATALSALVAFADYWKKKSSPPWGKRTSRNIEGPNWRPAAVFSRAGRSRPPLDALTMRLNQGKNYLRWVLKGLSSRHGHRKSREHRNRWVHQMRGRKGWEGDAVPFSGATSLSTAVFLWRH